MHYYLYDGTEEGFYTAVFHAYADKEAYVTCENVQLRLGDGGIPVINDENKAVRVLHKVAEYDRRARGEIDAILRSGDPARGQKAFLYVRLLVRRRAPVRQMHAEPAVAEALDVVRRVRRETHDMTGFLRFTETAGGVLYAPYSPDNDITEYLLPHFKARFARLPFVIHDVGREKAGLYNGRETAVVPLGKGEISLSADQEAFERLWRDYYAAIDIPERRREKQMRGYMPVRYWKFMPEKRP